MQKTMNDLSRKLRQKLRNKQRSQGGFTLVELIVVLVIMGLLTAALVPTVTGYVGDAKTKVAESNVYMVEQAARLYLTDLELNGTELPNTLTASQLVTAGYLSEMGDGEDYNITIAKTTGGYTVEVVEAASQGGSGGTDETGTEDEE